MKDYKGLSKVAHGKQSLQVFELHIGQTYCHTEYYLSLYYVGLWWLQLIFWVRTKLKYWKQKKWLCFFRPILALDWEKNKPDVEFPLF